MFKKFVFIPPLLLSLLFATAMIFAAIQGITTPSPEVVEVVATRSGAWAHQPNPDIKVSISYPVLSGEYEGEEFECRCQPESCELMNLEEVGGTQRILLEREDSTRCYDAARGIPGTNWLGSLALAALALLLAGLCVRALRAQGERTH